MSPKLTVEHILGPAEPELDEQNHVHLHPDNHPEKHQPPDETMEKEPQEMCEELTPKMKTVSAREDLPPEKSSPDI